VPSESVIVGVAGEVGSMVFAAYWMTSSDPAGGVKLAVVTVAVAPVAWTAIAGVDASIARATAQPPVRVRR
jgi:hypothetical protein